MMTLFVKLRRDLLRRMAATVEKERLPVPLTVKIECWGVPFRQSPPTFLEERPGMACFRRWLSAVVLAPSITLEDHSLSTRIAVSPVIRSRPISQLPHMIMPLHQTHKYPSFTSQA